MKSKLNITIDQEVLEQMKRYALQQKMSISEIVENYFRTISNPKRKNSFVEMIDKLPSPSIDKNINLRDEYYKVKAKKYGF